jgi:hypothetical protein
MTPLLTSYLPQNPATKFEIFFDLGCGRHKPREFVAVTFKSRRMTEIDRSDTVT